MAARPVEEAVGATFGDRRDVGGGDRDDLGDREALLQGQPDVFFSTPHYDGYPYVLVRLGAVDPVELSELIEDAWRLRAPKRVIKAFDADG